MRRGGGCWESGDRSLVNYSFSNRPAVWSRIKATSARREEFAQAGPHHPRPCKRLCMGTAKARVRGSLPFCLGAQGEGISPEERVRCKLFAPRLLHAQAHVQKENR